MSGKHDPGFARGPSLGRAGTGIWRSRPTATKAKAKRAERASREPRARRQTAVAIHYDAGETTAAPKVVASGYGHLAEKILEVAFAHGIKVREDADLAEMLAAVDIDSEIPVEAFIAVAEILRYVYAANGSKPPEIATP